jgi:hypothetical protein
MPFNDVGCLRSRPSCMMIMVHHRYQTFSRNLLFPRNIMFNPVTLLPTVFVCAAQFYNVKVILCDFDI